MLTISLVLLLATAARAENDNTASPATKNLRHQITSRLDSEFLNTVTRNTTIQDADISEICRRLGPGVAGCYGSCKNGAADCKPGNDGECQCVLPPPPADS